MKEEGATAERGYRRDAWWWSCSRVPGSTSFSKNKSAVAAVAAAAAAVTVRVASASDNLKQGGRGFGCGAELDTRPGGGCIGGGGGGGGGGW